MARTALVAAFTLLPLVVLAPRSAHSADPAPVAWGTDYNAARKEAAEKGLPLLIKFGTESCVYCKKMDATTFADPNVQAAINGNFVTLVIDGHAEQGLVKALQIQLYPTCVLASPDGKIHQVLTGFQGPDQLRAALQLSVTTAKAEAVVKAVTAPATTPEKKNPERGREVLALAKEAYRAEQYAACLDHCEYIVAGYAESPEAKEAAALLAGLKTDAGRLAAAADQLSERAAATQAAVADAYLKAGDRAHAVQHFEKAVRTNPDGKAALVARIELAKLTVVPASRVK